MHSHFEIPITNPVLVFAIVVFIILLAPILLQRYKIPGLIGLLLAGALIGPHGIGLLERDSAIILFGTVGILYIMFLAGLEFDLDDFSKNKTKSIIFGLFTFTIPLTIGSLLSYFVFGYSILSSILLASIFSSHTLLTYPILMRLGVHKNNAVTTTIGGTIITDTLALVILAIITSQKEGDLTVWFWVRFILSTAVFGIVVFYLLPKVAKWFFRIFEGEGVSQYLFVLTLFFFSAYLAELAQLEPIIGAFMSGLMFNRLIPHHAPLRGKIEFIGNAIFIPFFLLSVGMIINFNIFLSEGIESLKVATTLVAAALGAKYLAAYITQKVLKYSRTERFIIYGLSNTHAAAAIAVVTIGHEIGYFNEVILNSTILLILVSSLVSSLVTEHHARTLAIKSSETLTLTGTRNQRILVPLANPNTMLNLLNFAFIMRSSNSMAPVYALSIVNDDERLESKIAEIKHFMQSIYQEKKLGKEALEAIFRVDINVANAIVKAIKELQINQLIIGWNGHLSLTERLFGGVLNQLLDLSSHNIYVTKLIGPIKSIKHIKVYLDRNCFLEKGYMQWVASLIRLSNNLNANISLYGDSESLSITADKMTHIDSHKKFSQEILNLSQGLIRQQSQLTTTDLLIFISAREGSVSFSPHQARLPKMLSKFFQDYNFIIIYPEQMIIEDAGHAIL